MPGSRRAAGGYHVSLTGRPTREECVSGWRPLAGRDQETGFGNSRRDSDEPALQERQTADCGEAMTDVQYEESYPADEYDGDATASQPEDNTEGSEDAGEIDGTTDAAAESEESETDWGYDGKKKKVTREVMVGFAAIAVLVAVFGVVVAKSFFGGDEGDGENVANNIPEGDLGAAGDPEGTEQPDSGDVADVPGGPPGPLDSGDTFQPPRQPDEGTPGIADSGLPGDPERPESIFGGEPPPVGTVLPSAAPGLASVETVDPNDGVFGPGNVPPEATAEEWIPGQIDSPSELPAARPVGLLDRDPPSGLGDPVSPGGSQLPGAMPLAGDPSGTAPDPGGIPTYVPPGLSNVDPSIAGTRDDLGGGTVVDPFADPVNRSVPDASVSGLPDPIGFEEAPVSAVTPDINPLADPGFNPQPEITSVGPGGFPEPNGLSGSTVDSGSLPDPFPSSNYGPPEPDISSTGLASDTNDRLPGDLPGVPFEPDPRGAPIGALPDPSAYDNPSGLASSDLNSGPNTFDPQPTDGGFQSPVVSEDRGFPDNSLDQPGSASSYGSSTVAGGFAEPVPSTGASQQYTVASGDSFWTISKKVYGTGRHWQKLAEYNREVVPNADRIRPGTVLSVPDATVFGGSAVAVTSLSPVSEASNAIVPVETANRVGPAVSAASNGPAESNGFFFSDQSYPMYRVGKEDTLTTIAASHLGRASRWRQIYHMNRAALQSPDRLQIGMVLQLPADASRAPLIARNSGIR